MNGAFLRLDQQYIYVSSNTTDRPINTYSIVILLNKIVSLMDYIVSLMSANLFSQNTRPTINLHSIKTKYVDARHVNME
jgi:hypothetical protein